MLRPLVGRSPRLPCPGDPAALLPQQKAVVAKLGLECQLVSWVVCGLVDPIAPDDERAQSLNVGGVFPPAAKLSKNRSGNRTNRTSRIKVPRSLIK